MSSSAPPHGVLKCGVVNQDGVQPEDEYFIAVTSGFQIICKSSEPCLEYPICVLSIQQCVCKDITESSFSLNFGTSGGDTHTWEVEEADGSISVLTEATPSHYRTEHLRVSTPDALEWSLIIDAAKATATNISSNNGISEQTIESALDKSTLFENEYSRTWLRVQKALQNDIEQRFEEIKRTGNTVQTRLEEIKNLEYTINTQRSRELLIPPAQIDEILTAQLACLENVLGLGEDRSPFVWTTDLDSSFK